MFILGLAVNVKNIVFYQVKVQVSFLIGKISSQCSQKRYQLQFLVIIPVTIYEPVVLIIHYNLSVSPLLH